MQPLWQKTASLRGGSPLDGDIATDTLIIGGGICGLLCAYMLQQAGADYALVEAETICGGITKGTTAKITVQHGLIYDKLLKMLGAERASQYFQANEAALARYYSLCPGLDCDFEVCDSYVYSLDGADKINREIAAIRAVGGDAAFCKSLPLPLQVDGAVKFTGQAQFNPLKFAAGLSRGLNIYEHTRVRELVGTKAITGGGNIRAKNIIVATHFPFINKHGSYFIKLYQHRSYVLALENAQKVGGMYVDEAEGGLSFRDYGDLLLLGGGSHRTGKKGGNWQELRSFARANYPRAAEHCYWATQDCMSLDGLPYIGKYSAGARGLYVATGFNKWGMTSSMVAAMLLADMLQGKDSTYAALFSPSRSVLHPQLAVNAWEAAVSLLSPAARRCPHLGCALKWNPHEHSWDCPCHGSRFAVDGRLIDNPSTGDLK